MCVGHNDYHQSNVAMSKTNFDILEPDKNTNNII